MYFEAIFNPANEAEYSAEAADFVGKKLPIQEGWVIDDGPYKGQQCYYAPNTTIGRLMPVLRNAGAGVPSARKPRVISVVSIPSPRPIP